MALFLCLVSTRLAAQNPDESSGNRIRVPYAPALIRIDGLDLNQYEQAAVIRLDSRHQLVETPQVAWDGERDASAEVRLLYDEGHLYLFARIRDDDPLSPTGNKVWESGDVLELFFNLDPDDDRAGQTRFNDDDIQIVIPVHDSDRPWIAVTSANPGTEGEGMTGIETARREVDGVYMLEARIPLQVLPGIRAGAPEVGFNIALGDRDDGGISYNYLVWGGGLSAYDDTRSFGTLEFDPDGPAILVPVEDSGSRSLSELFEYGVYLLPCVGLFLVLLLARRIARGPLSVRPRLRLVLGLCSAGLLLLSIWVPDVLMYLHEEGRRQRAGEIADAVVEALPELEAGCLDRFRGPTRDEPLLMLLSGGAVQRRLDTEYLPLPPSEQEKLGLRPVPVGDQGLTILPYSLPIEGPYLELRLAGIHAGDRLAFVVSGGSVPPTLALRTSDALAEEGRLLRLDQQVRAPVGEGQAWLGMVDVDQELKGLRIDVVEGRDLRLEGVCHLPRAEPDHEPVVRPLELGAVSLAGVPTPLRGAAPAGVGIELAPTKSVELLLPSEGGGLDECWLFLEAVDCSAFRATPDKSVVGRLQFGNRDLPGTIESRELRHQIEVFAGRKDANVEGRRLEVGGPATTGYEWAGRDGVARMTPAIRVELDRRRPYPAMTLTNVGPYPLRLRSVVGARHKQDPTSPLESGIFALGPRRGEVKLSPELLARLEGAEFTMYREGRLRAGTTKPATKVARTRLSKDVVTRLAGGERVFGGGLVGTGTGARDQLINMPGDGWQGAVLAITLLDQDLPAIATRNRFVRLILIALSLPWVLVLLVNVLAPVGSLRWQLTGAVAFGMVVPLAVVAVFTTALLQKTQSQNDEQRLGDESQLVLTRLEEEQQRLDEGARSYVRKFALELGGLSRLDEKRREERLAELSSSLALLRPAAWAQGSFLSLSMVDPNDPSKLIQVHDRDGSLRHGDTALVEGAGLYSGWGRLFLGARADTSFEDGRELSFSWGRVVDDELLGELASQGFLGVYDLEGYPMALGSPGGDRGGLDAWLEIEKRPGATREKRGLLERVEEDPNPLFFELGSGGLERYAQVGLLRDRGGRPLAMMASFVEPTAAVLPFFFGALEVKHFFLLVVGAMLVFAVFLAWLLTDRITVPIERLEGHAERISRGDLEVEVKPVEGSDEISSLNRAFDHMARELRTRVRQQDLRNRAIARLNARLDLDHVGHEAVALLVEASRADTVLLLLQDRERRKVQVFGEGSAIREIEPHGDFQDFVFEAGGAFSLPLPVRFRGADFARFTEGGSCLVLPLRIQGRRWGTVMLCFPTRIGSELDLSFLDGLLGQVISSMETARVYRLAIEDATTGLHVARYFERQVAQELDRVRRSGGQATWIRFSLPDPERLRRHWGDEGFGNVLGRLGDELLHEMPAQALAGRSGLGSFDLLLPGTRNEDGRRTANRIRGTLMGLFDRQAKKLDVRMALVHAPQDGSSLSILKDELQRRIALRQATEDGIRTGEVPVMRRGAAVFASRAMHRILEDIDRVAPTELPLLVQGETGVGKEVLVDLCHEASQRAGRPLVKINCAAIPESLMEATLFGHEKGAFTGADERKKGVFEQAHTGTLFLDEVGDLPLELQAKLLRVLQSKEVVRLGGHDPVHVDVRVIAATHRDLERWTAEGRFREDLFYRLQGFRLVVPPLRERREEIPFLVESMRAEFGAEAKEFSAEALDLLYRNPWPGNIRELRNVVHRALVLARGAFVEAEDLDLAEQPASEGLPEVPELPEAEDEKVVKIPQPEPLRIEERWALLEGYLRSRIGSEATISPRVYRDLVGVSRRTASRDLSQWLDEGVLEATGQKRSLKYRIAAGAAQSTRT
ncbi:MAG: sigma 54-interacting transcriptional regulator [Planctomycetota bacterium]